MSDRNHILELKGISFTYSGEESPVWQRLNCSFKEGCINLVLGPSGCGKSTLLYTLNKIIPQLIEGEITGDIYFNEELINEKLPSQIAQHIGMVFQDPESQFCTFIVEDEIAFGLENLCVPEAQMEERIDRALEMVSMTEYKKALLDELSGGQKQKIAIASCLALGTEILVMDKPTANLDAQSRKDVFDLLYQLVDQYKKTIILVEHNLDGLLEKVEHAVVLSRGGEVLLQGAATKVFITLIWNQAYWQAEIYLPEKMLIIRRWLKENHQHRLVREYCQAMLEYYAAGEQVNFKLELKQFAEMIQNTCETEDPGKETLTPEEILSLQHVKFSYGSGYTAQETKPVIDDMGMTIRRGDFLALVGPNGVGKSTLMNIIFRVYDNYEGTIRFDGRELREVAKSELYKVIGLVFQNPELQFVTNDVYGELMYSLKNAALTEEEKEAKVIAMLERFHLLDYRNKSPFILSQGQKRRLSVASMLLTGQSILFLDEPTYGQDYENKTELMELLKDLNRDGVTIVVITHDMSIVAEYARHVILMHNGKPVFSGTPGELFGSRGLVLKGKLQLPGAFLFAEELRTYLPDFPACYTKEACLEALVRREEGLCSST